MLVIRTGYLYFEVLYLIKEKICAKNKGYCTFTGSEIVIFLKKQEPVPGTRAILLAKEKQVRQRIHVRRIKNGVKDKFLQITSSNSRISIIFWAIIKPNITIPTTIRYLIYRRYLGLT